MSVVFGSKYKNYIFLFLIILLSSIAKIIWTSEPLFLDSNIAFFRPVHTAIITESLYEQGFNPFETRGFSKYGRDVYLQEFPTYNMTVALLYLVFGKDLNVAVAVSIGYFACALVILYLFLKIYTSEQMALIGVFIFSIAPYSILFGRLIQPTSLNIFLLLLNLYLFKRYLDNPSWLRFSASIFVLLIHLLTKSIFLIMGLVMMAMLFEKGLKASLKSIRIWLIGLVPVVVTLAWSFYAMSITVEHYPHYKYIATPTTNFSGLFYIWKIVFANLSVFFTLPGLIMAFAGIFLLKKRSAKVLAIAWIVAFFVFSIPFSHVWKVHTHYHLFLALGLILPLLSSLQRILNTLSGVAKTLSCFFLILFFLLNSFLNITGFIKAEKIEFIRPVAQRIANATTSESRILFIGNLSSIGRWEWQYATNRTGLQENVKFDFNRIEHLFKRVRIDFTALIRWRYKKNLNPTKLNPSLRTNLFLLYPLKDSFLGEYLLFDTRKTNLELTQHPPFNPLNLEFPNGIKLLGYLIRNANSHKEIVMFWIKGQKAEGNFYLLAIDEKGDPSSLSHKILSNALPLKYWHKNSPYCEVLNLDEKVNVDSIKFILYDRSFNRLFLPNRFSASKKEDMKLKSLAIELIKKENLRFRYDIRNLSISHYSTCSPDWPMKGR